MPRCPVCDKSVVLDATPTAPFCSDRCRLVDLGRWLDESQAIPVRKKAAMGPLDGEDFDGDDETAGIAPDEVADD